MYELDLFISYAHIDNQPLVEGQDGWVTLLHKALEVRLSQLLGREVQIWRDAKLQGNDFFADEIVDKFGKVAAMVSVLSPRYVQSEWCVKELNEFCSSAGGLRVNDKSRVFKVVKTQIPLESHPEQVQSLLGYDFFTVDPETQRPREFSQVAGPEIERLFWAKLEDLAQDFSRFLSAAEEGGDPRSQSAAANGCKKIFLAETAYDLKDERDKIKRDLIQHGHQVVPAQPLPLIASELGEAIPIGLANCDLSVHLVGKSYGVVPDGATQSVVDLQLRTAAEQASRHELVRLIWIQPGLEIDDERQQALVSLLQTDPGAQEGADVLESPLEDLKAVIHRKLQPEEKPAKQTQEKRDGEAQPLRIYLIADSRDIEKGGDVTRLEDDLYDRGYEVILPSFDGDEAELRLEHQENLKECDAVVIYYGLAGDLWLRAKLRELRKIAGYGRAQPLGARAIYVADPPDPAKERLRTHEATILNGSDGFSETVIEPFLNELKE